MNDDVKEILVAVVIVLVAAVVVIFALAGLISIFNGWMNKSFSEGYEIILQGEVQLHRMEYSRGPWWNYPYTEVELRTFSGDTYSLELYGHHPLEHKRLYRITYTRISPVGHHQFLIGKVIEIEEVQIMKADN